MGRYEDILDVASETPAERRTRYLAEQDSDLLFDLVEIRKAQGLSQQDIADKLGLTQPTIAAFERYDSDPKLSTIRRYAHAVGAIVSHVAERDRGQLEWDSVRVVRYPFATRAEQSARAGWDGIDRLGA